MQKTEYVRMSALCVCFFLRGDVCRLMYVCVYIYMCVCVCVCARISDYMCMCKGGGYACIYVLCVSMHACRQLDNQTDKIKGF
jgi:hypothetical protein